MILQKGHIAEISVNSKLRKAISRVSDMFMYDYRNSVQGSEHEVYPTIQMRHAALERNKRCLLTYLYVYC